MRINKSILLLGFSVLLAALFYSNTGLFVATVSLFAIPLSVIVGLRFIYPVFRYAFSRGVSFFSSLAFALLLNVIVASLPFSVLTLYSKLSSAGSSGDGAVISFFVMPFVFIWYFTLFYSLFSGLYFVLKNKGTILIDSQAGVSAKKFLFLGMISIACVVISSNPVPRIVSMLSIRYLAPLCALSTNEINTHSCRESFARKESLVELQQGGGISIVETSYDAVGGLAVDNGRVIFAGIKEGGFSKEKFINVNGVEDGRHSISGEPIVTNGKIAFMTSRMINERAKYSVYYDGEAMQEDISMETRLFEHDGHVGYIVIEDENRFYVLNERKFGDSGLGLRNISFLPVGKSVAYVVQNGDAYFVKYDGNTLWEGADKPHLLYDMQGVPVYSVEHREKILRREEISTRLFIGMQEVGESYKSKQNFVFDGNEMAFVVEDEKLGGQKIYQRGNLLGREGSSYGYNIILGPFFVEGKLYYAGVDYRDESNIKTDVLADGRVLYSIPGVASDMLVSKEGKVALYVGIRNGKIYLDGKQLQYQEGLSTRSWGFSFDDSMQFVGERLIYFTMKDGIDSLCIDGEFLIEGFTEYFGGASDGDAVILAIKSQNKSSKVSFVVFGSPRWLDEFQKNIDKL